MANTTSKKKVLIVATCIVATAALMLLLALVSCSSQSGTTASGSTVPPYYEETAQENLSNTAVAKESENEPIATGNEEAQGQDSADAEACVVQEPIDDIRSMPSSYDRSSQSQPSPSAPQKHWVEDTKPVWVEDTAAWTEQKPIYTTREVSICNICNTDVTGNATAHGKAHMLAGEGSGHHSEVRQTITGYNTIQHEATGHWETRIAGGHWE